MATAVHIMQGSAASSSSTGLQTASTTAPVLEFVCLFTPDLRRKQKRWQDGRLKYHTFNRRVMVYDERGNFVGDTHWREDFALCDGEELQLERGGIIVQVAECTGSRDQDLSELVDKRAQEKAKRQSAAVARQHPTLEPPTPRPAVAAAPHFQLRHRPLHHLIGTPTGHHGRALIPSESPYEQRQQQLETSPAHSDVNPPAKRRKRDISPPSKSGYAQSLFGATLTLSGRPMSSAPSRRRPVNAVLAQRDDPCPTSSDRSNRESDMEPAPFVQRPGAAIEQPRDVSVGNRSLTNVPPRLPVYPPRRAMGSHRASSPILIEDTPEQQHLPASAQKYTSRSLKVTKDGRRATNEKRRNPLQPVPVNENQTLADSANQAGNGETSEHLLLDDDPITRVNRVMKWREARRRSSVAKQLDIRHETNTETISHTDKILAGAALAPKTSKCFGVKETRREDADARAPPDEPRTELRIKQRKKPGLLMLSEKAPSIKSTLKRKQGSTRNMSVDTPTSDPLEEGNSSTRRSKCMVPEDYEFESVGNRDRPERNSRGRQRERVRQDSVLAEEVIQIDDDQSEPSGRRSPTPKSTKTRPKPRDRASKTSLRPSHNTNDEDVAMSSDDPFKGMEASLRNKSSRRKRVKTVIEDEDDVQLQISSLSESRNRRLRKSKRNDTASVNAASEETDSDVHMSDNEDEVDLLEEPPTPRLAKIKNGIRSRELIGFCFDESEEDRQEIDAPIDDQPDEPHHSSEDVRAQPRATSSVAVPHNPQTTKQPQATIPQSSNQDDLLRDLSRGLDLESPPERDNEQPRGSEIDQITLVPVPIPDNSSRDIEAAQEVSRTEPQLPLDLSQNLEHPTETNLRTESGEQQSELKEIESTKLQPHSVSNQPQRQENYVQDQPDLGGNAQRATSDETEASLLNIVATRRMMNPASRGKKAAKPSDAAGKLPQCPLPPETRSIGLPRSVTAKKVDEAGKQDKGLATPLPGFAKANGGPWSREAFDLFEFKRPT